MNLVMNTLIVKMESGKRLRRKVHSAYFRSISTHR